MSAKVDNSLEDYVVIITLKVVNPKTINEDTVTQNIKIVRGNVDVEPESIEGKQWIRFKKVENQSTVPWSPRSTDLKSFSSIEFTGSNNDISEQTINTYVPISDL